MIPELTTTQQNIVNSWLNSYFKMYNIALKLIKENVGNAKFILNKYDIRDSLYDTKHEISKKNKILELM